MGQGSIIAMYDVPPARPCNKSGRKGDLQLQAQAGGIPFSLTEHCPPAVTCLPAASSTRSRRAWAAQPTVLPLALLHHSACAWMDFRCCVPWVFAGNEQACRANVHRTNARTGWDTQSLTHMHATSDLVKQSTLRPRFSVFV